jgi:hypothetical protein
MNDFYVYEYLRSRASDNGPSGSPYYIGKGRGRRAFTSVCHNAPPPEDRLFIHIIAKDMNERDALQAEVLLIRLHGRLDIGTGCLRNLTDGGEGMSGWKASPETKAKISAAMLGHNRCVGRKIAQATRDKIAASLSGRVGNRSGKHHSEESKARMSRSAKSRIGRVRGADGRFGS